MYIENCIWADTLKDEFEKDYYKNMWQFLNKAYEEKTIYPPKEEIYSAFSLTDYNDVKVMILGQDPYHGKGQAHGLSFSVRKGIKLPPSLKNIYKELVEDVGVSMPEHGFLESWAKQGVLMINASLTVEEKKPMSHSKIGWATLTDSVIRKLNERDKPIVFVLWGNFAISKEVLITNSIHKIIKSPHPSPFSARKGFFGSKPFSQINQYLHDWGEDEIDWSL